MEAFLRTLVFVTVLASVGTRCEANNAQCALLFYCPPEAVLYLDSRCFWVPTTSSSHDEAAPVCAEQSKGLGTLAVIESRETEIFIIKNVLQPKFVSNVWLGVQDMNSGVPYDWQWPNGSIAGYFNWKQGFPVGKNTNCKNCQAFDCVLLDASYEWINVPCASGSQRPLCQVSADEIDTCLIQDCTSDDYEWGIPREVLKENRGLYSHFRSGVIATGPLSGQGQILPVSDIMDCAAWCRTTPDCVAFNLGRGSATLCQLLADVKLSLLVEILDWEVWVNTNARDFVK